MIDQPISYLATKIALGYGLLALLSWLVTPLIGIVGVPAWMGIATLRIEGARKGAPLRAIELGGALPIALGVVAGSIALFIAAAYVGVLAVSALLDELFRMWG